MRYYVDADDPDGLVYVRSIKTNRQISTGYKYIGEAIEVRDWLESITWRTYQ